MIYKNTIHIVLKQVHPDTNISSASCEYISQYIVGLFYKIVSHIMKTKYKDEKITRDMLFDILQVLIGGKLFKHAYNEMIKYEDRKKNGEDVNSFYVCHDANLKAIKKYFKNIDIDQDILMLLLPCVEYLLAEILELAGNDCRDKGKCTIDTYHIIIAIFGDEELDQLIIRMNHTDRLIQQYQLSLDMLKYLGKEPN
jgi:hypothetical protein